MSEDLHRLEELLAEALERPPEERDAFLDRACAEDGPLRRQVAELLAVHDDAADYFDHLGADIAAAAPLEVETAAQPRLQIGAYQTLRAIGHGGMGAVYLARRVDGEFDQEAALKLLHQDMDTPQLRARFLAERQLLARLDHPHVARLLDGGVTEEGRPYFVMEHVEGVPITTWCRARRLSLEEILRLYLEVIDAVSYLHRNLVVHRDLKPSNILVDGDGRVKLLDFGIAKLLDGEPGDAGLTRTGERPMTPEYAAPEQLDGEPVTTATDVYALGVLLYELLTGERPHQGSRAQPAQRRLPPTPSSRLRSRPPATGAARPGSSTGRSPEPTFARRRISGDLDSICLEALRPEPEARYPSAEQLGQDVERFLQGLPVRARKSTLGYRLGKFVRRHRAGVMAAAVLVALVAVGFLRERDLRGAAEQARAAAQLEAAKAVAVSDFLGALLSSVDPMKAQGREVTVADVLDQAAQRIQHSPELAAQPEVEAAVRRTIGTTYSSLGRYEDAREHLERAVELSGGLEARHPEALQAAADLGAVYARLGLIDQAEPILRRVVEVRVGTLGEEHPDSLEALNGLADLLWTAGRKDEVEALDRRTLEIRRRTLGPDHPDTIKSLNGLGATLFNDGRYTDAAEMFQEALAGARRRLGDSHPQTLMLENNLAAAYLELGDLHRAEELLRQTVRDRIRVLGEEHPETVMSVHNLGVTLSQLGRYDEAEEQLRRAVAGRKRLPGAERAMLYSSSYLADVLREQGRYDEAETLYLSTLEQQRAGFGAEDAEALRTAGALAELRVRQGDLASAEALIDEVLDHQIRTLGEGHPDTLSSLTTLARVRIGQGRFRDAAELAERAVNAGSPTLGAEHPVVLEALLEKARALSALGEEDQARELARRVLDRRAATLGPEHPATLAARRVVEDLGPPAGEPLLKTVQSPTP